MDDDADPGEVPTIPALACSTKGDPLVQDSAISAHVSEHSILSSEVAAPLPAIDTSCQPQDPVKPKRQNPCWPTGEQYGPENPRCSNRRKPYGQ